MHRARAAGVFLPMLPTTPFLLLAAACFIRSSPALHRRLLASPTFGPFLSQWQRDRTVPRAAKHKAYVLVAVTFLISIALVKATWLRILLGLLAVVLIALLAWLPSAPHPRRQDQAPARLPTGGAGPVDNAEPARSRRAPSRSSGCMKTS